MGWVGLEDDPFSPNWASNQVPFPAIGLARPVSVAQDPHDQLVSEKEGQPGLGELNIERKPGGEILVASGLATPPTRRVGG